MSTHTPSSLSTRIRPLRRRLRRCAASAAALATSMLLAWVAPAFSDGPVWQALPPSGLSSTVNFSGVAEDVLGSPATEVVVAVGQDTASHTAVIYRNEAGTWYQDSIDGLDTTAGNSSYLTRVAIAGQTAWAVGSQTVGGRTEPLVVRLTGASSLTATQGALWTIVPASTLPSTMSTPRVLALGNSGNVVDGYIGGAGGDVWQLTDDQEVAAAGTNPAGIAFAQISPSTSGAPTTGPSSDVNDIRLLPNSTTQGFLVSGSGPPGPPASDGFFSLGPGTTTGETLTPQPASGAVTNNPIVAVAATSTTSAIALDNAQWCGGPTPAVSSSTPGYWLLLPASGGEGPPTWQRRSQDTPPGNATTTATPSQLCDVAEAGTEQVIAGAGADGDGAVWQRIGDGPGGWTAAFDLSSGALNGVAITGASEIWAVGDGGAVEHYSAPPAVASAAASDVTETAATLNATVNPEGYDTSWYFQWGTDASYGQTTSAVDAGAGTSSQPVSAPISGLTSGTTYHYRLVATDGYAATTYGSDQTLTTASPVVVTVSDGGGGCGACSSVGSQPPLTGVPYVPLQASANPPATTAKPPATKAKLPARSRPVLKDLAVRRAAQELIISFRLTAPASVAITASRAGRVIAQRLLPTLRTGRQRTVLRYAGHQPPTKLQIVVRPRKSG